MQIIKDLNSAEDYPVFYEHLNRWFKHNKNGAIPSITDVMQDDRLVAHRIIAYKEDKRIRYAQVGDNLEKLYGSSLVGKYIDQLYNPWFRKNALNSYITAEDEKLPLYEQRQVSTIIKKIGYQKLVLPLGSGEAVTNFATYIVPMHADIQNYDDWQDLVKQTPWL